MQAYKYTYQRGFTILELIVVVGILGLITSLTTDFMINETNQQRYKTTEQRMDKIHYALMGDSSRSLNNQPVFSGYLADTGEIPKYLRDLLSNGYCTNATISSESACLTEKAEWRFVNNWKGPYLQATSQKRLFDGNNNVIASIPVFRDGWGNHLDYNSQDSKSNDNLNFGWAYGENSADRSIKISSYGLNGSAGEDTNSESPISIFERDITRSINASQYQGVIMPLNIQNNSGLETEMFCLQAKYSNGSTKKIDLKTQKNILAGRVFGQVIVTAFKKKMNINDSCESATLYPAAKIGQYYSHNLFSSQNPLNVQINPNGIDTAGVGVINHAQNN